MGLFTHVKTNAMTTLNLDANRKRAKNTICAPRGIPKPTNNPKATPRASNQGGFLDDTKGSTKYFLSRLPWAFLRSSCLRLPGGKDSVEIVSDNFGRYFNPASYAMQTNFGVRSRTTEHTFIPRSGLIGKMRSGSYKI